METKLSLTLRLAASAEMESGPKFPRRRTPPTAARTWNPSGVTPTSATKWRLS